MSNYTGDNGWGEWKRRVLFQLEEQGKDIKDIEKIVQDIQKDLVVLKLKASLFGAGASAAIALIWQILSH